MNGEALLSYTEDQMVSDGILRGVAKALIQALPKSQMEARFLSRINNRRKKSFL